MDEQEYNGWKNRQTWNVALWIGNDEPLYRAAVEYAKKHPGKKATYIGFVNYAGLAGQRTPDNISFTGTRLDKQELNEMIRELAQD